MTVMGRDVMLSSTRGTRLAPRVDTTLAIVCAAAAMLAVLAAWPFGGLSYNDDFSYTFSALRLAQTGRFTYNGWGAPTLLLQAYWGALWIKLFGFSFTVVRLSMLPAVGACGAVAYALGRRCGVRPAFAAMIALLLVLSPLFLPEAASFMTDVPGCLFFLLVLMCVIAAGVAPSPAQAMRWIVLAAAVAIVGGLVRQTVWIVPVVGLPMVAWRRRNELATLLVIALGWISVALAAWLTVQWIKRQPFALPEQLLPPQLLTPHGWQLLGRNATALVLTLVAATLPVWLFALGLPRRWTTLRWIGVACCLAFVFLWCRLVGLGFRGPWIGSTVTATGVMGAGQIGHGRPPMFPMHGVWTTLSVATFIAAAFGLAAIVGVIVRLMLNQIPLNRLSASRWIVATLWVVGLVYFAALLPHCSYNRAYDRYVVPLLPLVCVPFMLAVQRESERDIGGVRRQAHAAAALRITGRWIGWGLLGLFALIAIAATQDDLALGRARMALAQKLQDAGVPREQIDGGFEFNAWTQLLAWGYMNERRITNPPGAFRPIPGLASTPACRPRYKVVFPALALGPSEPLVSGADVQWFSLIPPFQRGLVVIHVSAERYRQELPLETDGGPG